MATLNPTNVYPKRDCGYPKRGEGENYRRKCNNHSVLPFTHQLHTGRHKARAKHLPMAEAGG